MVRLAPRTLSLIAKCLVEIEPLGESLSVAVTVPDEQRRMTGEPPTLGLTLNVHVRPDRTFAVAVVCRPSRSRVRARP